jgi:hypothetical protein
VSAAGYDALLKKELDLFSAQRIPLDCGRVVGLFDPDIGPYVLEDGWLRKAANDVQISTSLVEALEDLLAAGAPSGHNLVQYIYFKFNLDKVLGTFVPVVATRKN